MVATLNYNRELNLREEIAQFFEGDDFGMPKYNILLQRSLRKTSDNKLIRCNCWNTTSQEGRIGCPDCGGVGTLWDEKLLTGYVYRSQYIKQAIALSYVQPVGRAENSTFQMISPAQFPIDDGDFIYTLKYNEEGMIELPPLVIDSYRIVSADKMQLDHNRTEYYISVLIKI